MRQSTLILALALALCSYPALAQQDTADSNRDADWFEVRVSLNASMHVDDGTIQLPSEIMARLTDEEALFDLEVTAAQRASATHVQARFAFDSMTAFNTWYESQPTRELFVLIEEKSRTAVELAVNMRRR